MGRFAIQHFDDIYFAVCALAHLLFRGDAAATTTLGLQLYVQRIRHACNFPPANGNYARAILTDGYEPLRFE